MSQEDDLLILDGMALAMAHELGSPLSSILLCATEIADQALGESPIAKDAQLIIAQVRRCQEILQTLTTPSLLFTKAKDPAPLRPILCELVDRYRLSDIDVTINALSNKDEEILFQVSPALTIGIGNILENAIRQARSKVLIEFGANGQELHLDIHDDGKGFDAASLVELQKSKKIKSSGENGLGLGIFLARTMLERTAATISFKDRSNMLGGARVQMSWPMNKLMIET